MRALAKPGDAGRWSDLRRRSLSAALLAPMALLCIWLGAGAWTVLMAVAGVGLGVEWVHLCGLSPRVAPGVAVPVAVLLGGAAAVTGHEAGALVIISLGGLGVWALSRRRALAAGVLYVGLPLVALAWLRGVGGAGRADVLFLVFVVWASDIGAYAMGRLVGGPKLAPRISPGKTWSGAVGGLVIAMAVGELAGHWLAPAAAGRAAAVAGVLGVVSVLGDLLESWIKRRFGVKDSGTLIPGHGGLLDRLDGLLAAAPAAAIMGLVMGREGVLWR